MKEKYIPSNEEVDLVKEIAVEHQMIPEQIISDQKEKQQSEDAKKIELIHEELKKVTFSLKDPVLEKYLGRVMQANSQENTKPVDIDSTDGKKIMKMVEECEGLINNIKESDLRYSIDGAIGLSLRQLEKNGTFLRKHRDIDIIVLENELSKLIEILGSVESNNKWGVFVWHTEDANKGLGMTFTPFNPNSFKGEEMLVAMPVNLNGGHDTTRYNGLTLIDIHYLKEDQQGTYNYNRLPVELSNIFSNEKVNLPNGIEVPVVDIVHMAIGKSKSERFQDDYDLKYILENITESEKDHIKLELNTLLKKTDYEKEKELIIKAIEKIK